MGFVRQQLESGLDRTPLVLIGAGGYAKSVMDSIDHNVYKVMGFIDEMTDAKMHLGYPILAFSLDGFEDADLCSYFISIGNNENRKRWYDALCARGLEVISVIDRSAMVSTAARLGKGCFVGKMAVVNSKVVIGDDVIVNTKALVEHGCRIGSHANISTNSVLNGDDVVGEGSFVGSGSVTLGQHSIGCWSMVGAGAVVTHDVGDRVTVAGVPARPLGGKAVLG